MSTLAMSEVNQQICDQFDLCEYGYVYLITMPDGYRFVSTNLDDDDLAKIKSSGATVNLLSELGV